MHTRTHTGTHTHMQTPSNPSRTQWYTYLVLRSTSPAVSLSTLYNGMVFKPRTGARSRATNRAVTEAVDRSANPRRLTLSIAAHIVHVRKSKVLLLQDFYARAAIECVLVQQAQVLRTAAVEKENHTVARAASPVWLLARWSRSCDLLELFESVFHSAQEWMPPVKWEFRVLFFATIWLNKKKCVSQKRNQSNYLNDKYR